MPRRKDWPFYKMRRKYTHTIRPGTSAARLTSPVVERGFRTIRGKSGGIRSRSWSSSDWRRLIDSKVPTRWYAVASVYKPNQEEHHRNDALLMRMYKQLTGLSRYAKTAAIWAPQKDSGLGMGRAAARHGVAVQREWIRHHSACKEYYRDGLREYLDEMHLRLGGCPAVLLSHQRETRAGPHVWDCLQHVVTYVNLPMWLPGECAKRSHILLQHKDADPMAAPLEKI